MPYNYGDIPDSFRTKKFFPIIPSLWKTFSHNGWKYIEKSFDTIAQEYVKQMFERRLDVALDVTKKIVDGKVKEPEEFIAYTLFPPGGYIRGDLQLGSMKLLYGASTDVSYVVIRDDNLKIEGVLNCHLEDGVPQDWFVLDRDDEVLNRRHMRLGWKMNEIPQHSKNLEQIGERILTVLKDVRNERTPEFKDSPYQVLIAWGTVVAHLTYELSYYEAAGRLWDAFSAKRAYGMPDYGMVYYPWPQMIKMITFLPRGKYLERLLGLGTEGKLVIGKLEPKVQDFIKSNFPWDYENIVLEKIDKKGLPWPKQSLGVEAPDFKDISTYEEEKFDWKFPKGKMITCHDLGLTVEETFEGIYLDIDMHTEIGSVDPSEKIIQRNIGGD